MRFFTMAMPINNVDGAVYRNRKAVLFVLPVIRASFYLSSN